MQGSYAAAVGAVDAGLFGGLGGGTGAGGMARAGGMTWGDDAGAAVVVGSGVLATVESPAPQPASAAAVTAATTDIRSPLTVGHRTAVGGDFPEGRADDASPLD